MRAVWGTGHSGHRSVRPAVRWLEADPRARAPAVLSVRLVRGAPSARPSPVAWPWPGIGFGPSSRVAQLVWAASLPASPPPVSALAARPLPVASLPALPRPALTHPACRRPALPVRVLPAGERLLLPVPAGPEAWPARAGPAEVAPRPRGVGT